MTGEDDIQDQSEAIGLLLEQHKPGEALRFLREQKGVSVEQVSTESLIPDSKIRDLESDVYDKLGGEIFVVGYFRKIAKILGVDSDPLVASYHQAGHSAVKDTIRFPSVSSVELAMPRAPGALENLMARVKKVPIWLAVVILLTVWMSSVLLLQSGSDEAVEPVQKDAPAVERAIVEPESAAKDEMVEVGDTSPIPSTHEQGVDMQGAVAEEIVKAAVVAAPDTTPEPAPATSPELGSNDQDRLALTFTEDCWVRISDATGEVLFAQLQRTGDNLQLFGEAPFDVMLGNARAVDILINGQPVTITPIPGNNSLKLRVEP